MKAVYFTTVSCMLVINYLTAQELRMQPAKFQDATIREDPANPGRLKIDETGISHINKLPPLETDFLGSLVKDIPQLFTNYRKRRLHRPQNTETESSRSVINRAVAVTNFQDVKLGQSVNGGLVPVPNLRDVNLGRPVNGGLVSEINLQDLDVNQRMNGGDVLGRNMRDRELVQPIHNKFIPVTNLRDVQLKHNGDNQTKAVDIKETSDSVLPLPRKDYQDLSSYRDRRKGSRPTNRRHHDAAQNDQRPDRINKHNRHAHIDSWSSSTRQASTAIDRSTHQRFKIPVIGKNKWRHFSNHHNRHDLFQKKYFPQNIMRKANIQRPFLSPHRRFVFG